MKNKSIMYVVQEIKTKFEDGKVFLEVKNVCEFEKLKFARIAKKNFKLGRILKRTIEVVK